MRPETGALSPGKSGLPDTSAAASTEPRSSFGPRYEIEQVLGEGGMGKVLKAWDKELGRSVALKLIRPEYASDPNSLQRFKKELLLARQISHKNILRIHDLGDIEGTKFISMAFIDGKDLHKLFASSGKFPLERSLKIARQICAALEAAHSEGVVHRDLKPQNILVDNHDNVYVSDFGLAKSLVPDSPDATQSALTRSGEILGTPRYMAPEQVIAQPADHRSDIYSFGLIFYEMVAGDIPFAGRSMVEMMYQRVEQKPRNPQDLNHALPDSVAHIIMRCLEKDPAKRYQSATEVLAELDAMSSSGPADKLRSLLRFPRLSRRAWILIGIAAFAISLSVAAPSLRNIARNWRQDKLKPPVKAPKYIAVLPVKILGADESLRFVADGILESLSARLFTLKSVHLASSAAVEKADLSRPAGEIANTLGVNLLIRATLQGTGEGFRITITMDDTGANKRVFAGDFSGLAADLLSVEDDIFNKISTALSLDISSEELARGALRHTEDIDAYQLYLQGLSAFRNRLDMKSLEKALEFYDQAIQKDPDFTLAYTGLAETSLLMWNHKRDPIWIRRAQGAAEQAKRLNDLLPEVHYSLGSIYLATGKTSEAIVELKRAQELAPGSDESFRKLGSAYRAAGRYPEAIDAFRKAVEVNPYYWLNYNELGAIYIDTGKNDEAQAAFIRATGIEPRNDTGYINLGISYYRQGKWAECINSFNKAIRIKPTYLVYTNLGVAYLYSGRYREAAEVFSKAVEMQPDDHVAVANLADAHRWLGEKEKAEKAYGRAIELALETIRVNPRHANTLGLLAVYYAKKQDTAKALQFIRRARSIDRDDNSLIYYEAIVYAIAGQNAKALASLREAFQKGYPHEEAENDPELKSLKSDPGYGDLLREFSHPKPANASTAKFN
jgi:serine/threonine protein kinase/Flp pilus assembly protein TadD